MVIQYIFAYVCLIFKTAGNKNLLRVLSRREGSRYEDTVYAICFLFFLRNILMKCKAKDRRSVDFFCEVGSITGQGVMRIYVESSIKKPNFFKKQNFEKSEGAKWF